MKGITLLGATGSVGSSTLDVLRSGPTRWRLEAVAAGRRADVLARIVREFRPALATLADASAATPDLRSACAASATRLVLGETASLEAAASPGGDIVVAAIVGAAGLPATAVAVRRGATVALANKECLVVAGEALTNLARSSGSTLLPVDSEHAALHQCLRAGRREEVRRLILTASGGPFRTRPADTFDRITVEEALAHPTWRMGAKITIDSATLVNKGLELIEAHWLFGFPSSMLDVVLHPQSIVHSLVEFRDGSVLAQLSKPDMRDPVRYCLSWPDRLETDVPSLDLPGVSPLTFEAPDERRFPALGLARQALTQGGAAPAVLNAANEVAVAAFLEGRIPFTAIPAVIEDALPASAGLEAGSVEAALEADRVGRGVALERMAREGLSMAVLDWIQEALLFIVVLGLLISFHEFGHFVVAKLARVKVEVFSFGIGTRLFGVRVGDTDYRVSAIPLGGYVRMAGDASLDPDAPPRPRAPTDFESKGLLARLAIMVAGPVFNLVAAVGLLALVFVLGAEAPAFLDEAPRVGTIEPDSPAQRAGLMPGDLVLAVNGRPIDRWEVLLQEILVRPDSDVTVDVDRGGERIPLHAHVESQTKHATGWLGIAPCARLFVHAVVADSPAARAGVRPGDEIVAVAGQPPCSSVGLVEKVQAAAGKPLDVSLGRNGAQVQVSIAARHDVATGSWLMGIRPKEQTVIKKFAPVAALRESLRSNWKDTTFLLDTAARLFTLRLSMRSMSGPMELADAAQDAASSGFVSVLGLMSLISLNLGIFNLFPIPILDGGRIAMMLVEAVRGRELERRTKEWILTAGAAVIAVLMLMVLYFDVLKKLEG